MSIKKALLVGINKYQQPDVDLKGCVNDVVNMRQLLSEKYKFELDNIRVLTDERATKQAILERLDWLIKGSSPGDVLVFHNSSHGSQIRDRNGDELEDHLDELICTTDINWDDPLTDDYLRDLFVQVPEGVSLDVIIDACHSGSITKSFFGKTEEQNVYEGDIQDDINPQEFKDRFLAPPIDIQSRSEGRNLFTSFFGIKQNKNGVVEHQNHILIAGCQDNQTSADAYINGIYQGAFTYSLIDMLSKNDNLSWEKIHKLVVKNLKQMGFSQTPRLSGNKNLLNRIPFM